VISKLLIQYSFSAALLFALNVGISSSHAQSGGLTQDRPEAAHAGASATPTAQQTFRHHIVSTANLHASAAGLEILRAGGSAVDAAIAAQLVLTLVEPQSSGIGGGALMLHFNGQSIQAYDGRETAPRSADTDLWLRNREPIAFQEAVIGGRSVGTPGVLRLLELAHRHHGRLAWPALFAPAIRLAENGFEISPRLNALLQRDPGLRSDPRARAFFYSESGHAHPVGMRLRNQELAVLFREIAQQGAKVFYQGAIARQIVTLVQQHPTAPGLLDLEDLKDYQPIERQAICFAMPAAIRPNTGIEICGFPPPSSGALTIGQILQMLSALKTSALSPKDLKSKFPASDLAQWMHFYIEAARLAFADRALFIADPDFVAAPAGDWNRLLAPTYIHQRAQLIRDRRSEKVTPGNPAGVTQTQAAMPEQAEAGTSHLAIADRFGNVVSMTSTIESAFGARLMVGQSNQGGFLLNNQLTDFSFQPKSPEGVPIANRVEPGKRPRSSMSPTMIFERNPDGSRGPLIAALGSPGGASILHYTAKTILGFVEWSLDLQAAIDLPNFSITGPQATVQLELGHPQSDRLKRELVSYGQSAEIVELTSGIQAIARIGEHWHGGADRRREGVTLGD